MKAIRTKKPNATLIFRGLICSTIGIGLNYILLYLDTEMLFYSFRFILDFIGVISIPICISWFLGRDFAHMNRNLFTKLKEVEQLSAEKQQLLAQQKETLERQVAERTRALNQSIADLQAAQAQLIQKEKMASLGELTAGIAHEIQNPLNFVNNFAEVSIELAEELEESVQSGNQESVCVLATDLRTNMDYIVQNGQRASSIVRAMLEHSRSSTGERQPTDLNALAEEYLRLAYHGFRAKNPDFQVQLHTDFEPGLACLQLVAQDMGRVLLNLYNNAFYAVSEKQQLQKTVVAGDFAEGETGYQPQVWVCTRQVNGYVEVRVKDNGVGIPENIRDKVFQPFFTTKPTGQGTGLGLSLSYEVVTKGHGGEMTVESQAGQFTEFSICLPLNR
jgi:signal transduction histidine kinase